MPKSRWLADEGEIRSGNVGHAVQTPGQLSGYRQKTRSKLAALGVGTARRDVFGT
jgi:hypothetical protein